MLVGAAAVQQHDGADGDEAIELMIQAVQQAAQDTEGRSPLGRATIVAVPRGTWGYSDPARLVSEAIGAKARTVLAQLGVLQQTLLTRACTAIASGDAEVVVVCGGEARDRSRQALRAGRTAHERIDANAMPDEVLVPDGDIIDPLEIQRALGVPAHQYAVMENALRAADGQTLDEYAMAVANLWAGFSRVAAANPDAWSNTRVEAEALMRPSPGNRLISFPYTRQHVSQWNVNQAAALILASAEAAADLGVPRDRWVFPRAAVESNTMIPLVRRTELHRCPAVRVAAARALRLAGVDLDDIGYIDLYSCFPVAVRIQAQELGLTSDRELTVTGGMTFAGGPLNNYVLQAMVKMTELLRADAELLRADSDAGAVGLVSSVSGMLTKQAFGVWSTEPPERGFAWADVSAMAAQQTSTRPVTPTYEGRAVIASYTVIAGQTGPERAVVVADLPDGSRTIATSEDIELAHQMTSAEWCGRPIEVRGATFHASG